LSALPPEFPPKRGRPWRLGRVECFPHKVLRNDVYVRGLTGPNWWDASCLLPIYLGEWEKSVPTQSEVRQMVRSDPEQAIIVAIIRPYLKRVWLKQVARRTVERQVDLWLDEASAFVERHPEFEGIMTGRAPDPPGGTLIDLEKLVAARDSLNIELGHPAGVLEPD
jgi:hypothetical protein